MPRSARRFLERGRTEFRASATRSRVFEGDFGQSGAYQKSGSDFDWPSVPGATGGHVDLRVYNSAPVSAGFTTHLMDPHASTLISWRFLPPASWRSAMSGHAAIFHGSAFGKKTTAVPARPGAAER